MALGTFRIDDEIWEQFKQKTSANGTSASEAIKVFIDSYLQNETVTTEQPKKLENESGLDSRIDERIDKALDTERLDIEKIIENRVLRTEHEYYKRLDDMSRRIDELETRISESQGVENQDQVIEPGTVSEPETLETPIESLNQSELAKRLELTPSALSKAKKRGNFPQWTKEHDPDGIAWVWVESSSRFEPEVPPKAIIQ